jgi:hypothetical protein
MSEKKTCGQNEQTTKEIQVLALWGDAYGFK